MNATKRAPLRIPRPINGLKAAAWLLKAGLSAVMACWMETPAASETDELASDQISVRELMRLETAQALQRMRAATAGSASDTSPLRMSSSSGGQAPAARLVAIYGVGRKLMAEVRVDGQTLLFMRGRPEAVGPGRAHAMRLLAISDRCVEVAMQGRRESLCAAPAGVDGN